MSRRYNNDSSDSESEDDEYEAAGASGGGYRARRRQERREQMERSRQLDSDDEEGGFGEPRRRRRYQRPQAQELPHAYRRYGGSESESEGAANQPSIPLEKRKAEKPSTPVQKPRPGKFSPKFSYEKYSPTSLSLGRPQISKPNSLSAGRSKKMEPSRVRDHIESERKANQWKRTNKLMERQNRKLDKVKQWMTDRKSREEDDEQTAEVWRNYADWEMEEFADFMFERMKRIIEQEDTENLLPAQVVERTVEYVRNPGSRGRNGVTTWNNLALYFWLNRKKEELFSKKTEKRSMNKWEHKMIEFVEYRLTKKLQSILKYPGLDHDLEYFEKEFPVMILEVRSIVEALRENYSEKAQQDRTLGRFSSAESDYLNMGSSGESSYDEPCDSSDDED